MYFNSLLYLSLVNNYYIITIINFTNLVVMKIISISINEPLYEKLRHIIPSKKISQFVNLAISHELEKKEQELTLAYRSAEQDKGRQELLSEWDEINDI